MENIILAMLAILLLGGAVGYAAGQIWPYNPRPQCDHDWQVIGRGKGFQTFMHTWTGKTWRESVGDVEKQRCKKCKDTRIV